MSCKKLLQASVLFALLLFSQLAYSQNKTISGKVIDSRDGSAVAGVNINAKGTSTSTQSSSDGTYQITVEGSVTTLIFSSVGFTTLEIPLNGRTAVDAALIINNSSLAEVVVIGYGTTRKKDLTGSVSTVTSKDFQKGAISTPEQLIAGKVAGVSIISNGGAPGSGSSIRIRGGSSLNASNDPLIVVDGVPLDNGGISGSANPLSFINPNDIESFTVLKDASAAAIYGTRASNGVILITTKKGRSGKVKVSFNSINSISSVTKQVEVLNADQVRAIVNELGTTAQKSYLGTANTNWQDEIYQNAFASDNNISITGGISKLPYRLSVGYLNQEGVLLTDKLQRTSVGLTLNPLFFDNHLKVDINLRGSAQKTRFADQGAIGAAVYFNPTQPVRSNSKRFGGYFEWLDDLTGNPDPMTGRNPVGMLTERFNEGNAKRSIGNIQFDYKLHFFPDLRVNLNLGYDISEGKGTIFVSDSAGIGFVQGVGRGTNNEYRQKKTNKILEFYLNYVKDIPSIKSRVDLMGGYSFNNYQTTNYHFASFYANGTKIPDTDPDFPFNKPENTLISYFGRLNYTLNDKYLLTATLRRDGSSRFAPENRWGLFPSVALAWKLREEDFLRNNKIVSDLKLRLGYGVTGQQDGIADYQFLAVYAQSDFFASYPFGVEYNQMFRPSGYNANIKWEQTATTNLAIDYGFLDNRITGSIDFYHKKTNDLLTRVPVAAGTNFSAFMLANVGDMTNKGVEFNINGQPIRNRDMVWDISFNATYNKNEIKNLTVIPNDPNYIGYPSTGIAGTQGFAFLNAVGGPKNTFYLYHQVYDQNGRPIEGLFEDVNRDGILNEQDKYKGKQADPNLFFGLSTNFSYKKWNAGFTMRASFNNYVYNNIFSNNGRLNQVLPAYKLGNASINYLETGFKGNTEQQLLSDYYIQNASFLRMDNLNIGYNFGSIAKNVATLRLNLSVQNVFVITKYEGLDPEIRNGVDAQFYPRPRIIALGINLDF